MEIKDFVNRMMHQLLSKLFNLWFQIFPSSEERLRRFASLASEYPITDGYDNKSIERSAMAKMKGSKPGDLFKITRAVYLSEWRSDGFYAGSPLDQDEDIFIPVRKGHSPHSIGNGRLVLCTEGDHVMWLGWQEIKIPTHGEPASTRWPVWLVGSKKAVGWIREDCFEKVLANKKKI